ncbi:MAG: hypothetical protein Q8M15_06435 [Bacteroidota bacterium]|nr:hypothetical protein [Bacteroidota bacterium]
MIISFFFGCSHPNRDEESKERNFVLKNNIKKITEYLTIINPGEMQLKEQINHEKLYDDNGFKIKEIIYNDDGVIENIISLNYDKKGNLIFRKAVKPDSSISYSDARIFDAHSNKTDYYFYNPDGSVLYKKAAKYDNYGRLTESRMYHDGVLKAVNKYTYQDMQMLENEECDSAGNFRHKWLYKFDEFGNLTEEAQYNVNNYCTMKNLYEFNMARQLVKEIKYIGAYIQYRASYQYNGNGLLDAKIEYSTNGKISARYRYQYGIKKNI